MDPGAPPPSGTPVTMEALMDMMPKILDAHESNKSDGSGKATVAELSDRLDEIERMLFAMAGQLGISPAALGVKPGDVGQSDVEAAGGTPPPDAAPPDEGALDQTQQPFTPQALDAMAQQDPGAGIPPPGMAPPGLAPPMMPAPGPAGAPMPGMQVQAALRPLKRGPPTAAARIQNAMSRMRAVDRGY
jgi:splicing factor 3B subunit 4